MVAKDRMKCSNNAGQIVCGQRIFTPLFQNLQKVTVCTSLCLVISQCDVMKNSMKQLYVVFVVFLKVNYVKISILKRPKYNSWRIHQK